MVDSLDKQIQNEKEPIRLASDKGKGEARGGYFVFVWGVLIDFDLTWLLRHP